ncbi:MAG: hypothetical protein K2Q18_17820 [Bdellovibrionales bacterium]|nr:hypothetical protein [Bdellovibrionales bacterium]
MSKKTFLAFFFATCFLAFQAMATTFVPIPLEKLIDESNSAAEVELKAKKSYMNQVGLIFTEYTFSLIDSYNLASGDLEGEVLKLTMTGGSVNGVTSYIDGAPEFEVGEKSFLLLKKVESKLYLSNFTMGKYKIEESNGKKIFISSVFPNDPDLGKVSKERMVEIIKTKFKISDAGNINSIVSREKNKKFFQRTEEIKFRERRPAQDCMVNDCVGEKQPSDGLLAMWGFLGLFVCTAFTIWWKLRKTINT